MWRKMVKINLLEPKMKMNWKHGPPPENENFWICFGFSTVRNRYLRFVNNLYGTGAMPFYNMLDSRMSEEQRSLYLESERAWDIKNFHHINNEYLPKVNAFFEKRRKKLLEFIGDMTGVGKIPKRTNQER